MNTEEARLRAVIKGINDEIATLRDNFNVVFNEKYKHLPRDDKERMAFIDETEKKNQEMIDRVQEARSKLKEVKKELTIEKFSTAWEDAVNAKERFLSENTSLFIENMMNLPIFSKMLEAENDARKKLEEYLKEEGLRIENERIENELEERRNQLRYKKEHELADSLRLGNPKCVSCGTLRGWWCRGCGTDSKKIGIRELGFDEEVVEDIIDKHFGGCNLPMVPCYVCNRDGAIPHDDKRFETDSDFWRIK